MEQIRDKQLETILNVCGILSKIVDHVVEMQTLNESISTAGDKGRIGSDLLHRESVRSIVEHGVSIGSLKLELNALDVGLQSLGYGAAGLKYLAEVRLSIDRVRSGVTVLESENGASIALTALIADLHTRVQSYLVVSLDALTS